MFLFTQLKIFLTKEKKDNLFLEIHMYIYVYFVDGWTYHFVLERCIHSVHAGACAVPERQHLRVFKPLN